MSEIKLVGVPRVKFYAQFYNADLLPVRDLIPLGFEGEDLLKPFRLFKKAVACKVFKKISVYVKNGKRILESTTENIFESGFIFNEGILIPREFAERYFLHRIGYLDREMKERGANKIVRTRAGTIYPFCGTDVIIK